MFAFRAWAFAAWALRLLTGNRATTATGTTVVTFEAIAMHTAEFDAAQLICEHP